MHEQSYAPQITPCNNTRNHMDTCAYAYACISSRSLQYDSQSHGSLCACLCMHE
eukprot:jgi/Botrbrau1/10837/Bobra.0025s0016.1